MQPDAGEAAAKPPRSDPGSLLAAVGQAVIATNRSGLIQYWNRAAQDLYGYTAEEVSGRPLIEVIAPPEAEHLVMEWTARLGADESYAGDWPRTIRAADRSASNAMGSLRGVIIVKSRARNRLSQKQ